MVIFAVLRCGTAQERTEVLDFTLWILPNGSHTNSSERSEQTRGTRISCRKRGRDAIESLAESLIIFNGYFRARFYEIDENERLKKISRLERLLQLNMNFCRIDADMAKLLEKEIDAVKR